MKTSVNRTPFEPGAKIAADAPPAPAAPTPCADPSADPSAALEAKIIELYGECDGKISDLKARAAELKRQAGEKEVEYRRIAAASQDAFNINRVMVLQKEAGDLLHEARRLINIDLRKLEQETIDIGGGAHPALTTLRLAVENKMSAERRKLVPEKLPSLVILGSHFGWQENGSTMSFSEGQIVRDPELIQKLFEHKAPLEMGVAA